MPPRKAASASVDAVSVPLPCIGIEIDATCLSRLTSTLSGPFILPVANALSPSALVALAIWGVVTSFASMFTTAGIWPPGKLACMRS
jgi:hypothetical protein